MPLTKRTATATANPDFDLAEYERAFKRMQTQVQSLCDKVVALRNEVRALKRENASIPVATPVATPVSETTSSASSSGETLSLSLSPPSRCVIDVDVEPEPECNSVGGALAASCCTASTASTASTTDTNL